MPTNAVDSMNVLKRTRENSDCGHLLCKLLVIQEVLKWLCYCAEVVSGWRDLSGEVAASVDPLISFICMSLLLIKIRKSEQIAIF